VLGAASERQRSRGFVLGRLDLEAQEAAIQAG
jgi:hypothetical protein